MNKKNGLVIILMVGIGVTQVLSNASNTPNRAVNLQQLLDAITSQREQLFQVIFASLFSALTANPQNPIAINAIISSYNTLIGTGQNPSGPNVDTLKKLGALGLTVDSSGRLSWEAPQTTAPTLESLSAQILRLEERLKAVAHATLVGAATAKPQDQLAIADALEAYNNIVVLK